MVFSPWGDLWIIAPIKKICILQNAGKGTSEPNIFCIQGHTLLGVGEVTPSAWTEPLQFTAAGGLAACAKVHRSTCTTPTGQTLCGVSVTCKAK